MFERLFYRAVDNDPTGSIDPLAAVDPGVIVGPMVSLSSSLLSNPMKVLTVGNSYLIL